MLFSDRVDAPTSPCLLLYHIFSHLSTTATIFFKIFFAGISYFLLPPGGARRRTDARDQKRRTAARKDGEGPHGRTERREGRGPGGPDTRAGNKHAHEPEQTGWGAGGGPPGEGVGGSKTPKKPGRAPADVADVSIVSSASAQRTKAGHETRAQTGKNGKTRDAAGPGTIGNRTGPASAPRGAPAWEVGPQTERRLRSADAREPELHNTRPWGGGPL